MSIKAKSSCIELSKDKNKGLFPTVVKAKDVSIWFIYLFVFYLGKVLTKIQKTLCRPGAIEPWVFEIARTIEAASELGIKVKSYGFGVYEFSFKEKTRIIKQDMRVEDESCTALFLCGHKGLTFKVLKDLGFQRFPSSKTYSLGTIQEARSDFAENQRTVVVKPCQGTSGGKGVTVGVESLETLNKAIYRALLYDKCFLIEDYVEGDHYRLLFCGGQFIDGIRRFPASVTGDGRRSLKRLITDENRRRSQEDPATALYKITIDGELKHYLKSCNLSLSYVPGKNETLNVKRLVNMSGGGGTEEVSHLISASIIDECAQMIKGMRVYLAGIDIITKDISGDEFYVNELNTTPGLDLHYKVVNQPARKDVIADILKCMFDL